MTGHLKTKKHYSKAETEKLAPIIFVELPNGQSGTRLCKTLLDSGASCSVVNSRAVHHLKSKRAKIISFKIKNKIIYGLSKIQNEISNKKFEFNKKYEDIHMNIEKRLFQIIGEEAGYVHTARSRNDQVITDFKIWIRSSTKEINLNLDKVIKSTLKLAEKNIDTIMPGFTHLKNAQAISFAHYLMAYVEMFSRDKKRFKTI